MRTSKNVQACPGGGRIFYHSALLCRQLESISLSHPADGYDANKLLEQKGQDWGGEKKGSRRERGDEQSCREGKDMNKICILCHQCLPLLQTVMKEKLLFYLPASEFHCGCLWGWRARSAPKIWQNEKTFGLTLTRNGACVFLLHTHWGGLLIGACWAASAWSLIDSLLVWLEQWSWRGQHN